MRLTLEQLWRNWFSSSQSGFRLHERMKICATYMPNKGMKNSDWKLERASQLFMNFLEELLEGTAKNHKGELIRTRADLSERQERYYSIALSAAKMYDDLVPKPPVKRRDNHVQR